MKSTAEEVLLVELLGDLGRVHDQIKTLPKSIPRVLGWKIMAYAFTFSLFGCAVGAFSSYLLLGGEERRVQAEVGKVILERWSELEDSACAKIIMDGVRDD